MTVEEVVKGLCFADYQRIVVKSHDKDHGYVPLAGGFREKVLRAASDREVTASHVVNNCLHLTVKFEESDLL